VQHLADQQQFVRSQLELAHVERPGGQGDRARLDPRHPQHRHEDPPPGGQLHDQADGARGLSADAEPGDDVPHPADRLAVRAENRQAGEPGDEHPGRGCHAVRLRSSRPIRRSSGRVCARALGGSRTHRSWYTRIHGPELEEEIVDGQRARRSCLAVPGSSAKMIDKARTLPADQFFLDLEDAVSPLAKDEARQQVVAALDEGGWSGKVRSVRVNSLDTEWTYRDVITVVEGAGAELDTIILPKVSSPDHVRWLDLTLTQVERANGLDVGR